jgi:hypothetical protein
MAEPALLRDLLAALADYSAAGTTRKRDLLAAAARLRLSRAADVQALQRAICFLRAFPDDARIERAARRLAAGFAERLARLPARERGELDDSGAAGSTTRHVFGHAAARWLARRHPRDVVVDWRRFDSPAALAPLLQPLLDPMEDENTEFDDSGVRDWLRRARGGSSRARAGTAAGTDLAWLLAQAPGRGVAAQHFAAVYDAAEVPLAWRIDDRASITGNRRAQPIVYRATGLRRPAADPRAAITAALPDVRLLPRRAAARLLDVWRAALWSRTRTVFQIEQPNLDECWQADFGGGLQMAAIGVRPGLRSTLEVTYGYLLLANGMPIGYGGFTTLFSQVNTGINVFPEYRGGEAAFAFEQALRAMHALTGCAHVIVNPYQFGAGNDEALASGAYWFYYRLGFRSVEPAVARLAQREFARLRAQPGRRAPLAVLRQLAACDLRLDLAAGAQALFDEAWLPALGRGITDAIAHVREANRGRALALLVREEARRLGADTRGWSRAEHAGLAQFAPLLAQIDDLASWPAIDKRAVVELIRARQAPTERPFIGLLRGHARLREALARVGRRGA